MFSIAYLINQYPAISHSFIRREIAALEAENIQIFRFSIRPCKEKLVDKADKLELEKTNFILGVGIFRLFLNLIYIAIARPMRFARALKLALNMGWGKDKGVLIHLAYLAEACVLLRWVSKLEISHIHTHFAFNPTTVAFLCHALGGPTYSFTVHGPEEIDRAIILSLDKKIAGATFVAAISSFCQSQLYRWCERQYWSKIHLIHCGLDSPFLTHPIMPIPETSQLVCVGRLSEQKGHLVLLEAAYRLATEGLNFKLVLVGDGPLRPQIEALIAEFKLQNRVEITGWANNDLVAHYIINSRAMVLASFAEGLPVVMMEALALGRPVIGTYVAGIPELIEPEVCGWLVPPGSVEALTSAMRKVLELPNQKLQQMGEIGAKRVALQHDVAIEAKKLATLFRQSQLDKLAQETTVNEVLMASPNISSIKTMVGK
jgi:glycosyltransferase involved in cell wall biosynthesis